MGRGKMVGTGKVEQRRMVGEEGGGHRAAVGTGGGHRGGHRGGQAIPGCSGQSHTQKLRRPLQTWERCH